MTECKAERKRAYAPKTRTGCRTCKLRRIKCDEAKPFCKRCTSTGRQCDGYSAEPQNALQVRPINILPKNRLIPLNGSLKDEFDLDFFSRKIAPKLAGFYDIDVWSVAIPQLGYNEPAIRLAIQAVTALHKEVEKQHGNIISEVDPSILQDYNNAIRHLVQDSGKRAHIDAAVIALFVCLEFLVGNEDAASIHINGGLKLIKDWQKRSRSSTPDTISSSSSGSPPPSSSSSSYSSPPRSGTASEIDIMEDLNTTFSRLAVHSKVYGKHLVNKFLPEEHGSDKNASSFDNLNQARDEGFAVAGDGMSFVAYATQRAYTNEVTEEWHDKQRQIVARAFTWRRAFKEFTRKNHMHMTPMQMRAGNIVQCLVTCTYIWVTTCLTPYEEDYDKYTSEFQEVIDLCSMVLDVTQDFLCDQVGRFQIDMGLVPCLHFTGSRCRVPSIRLKAFELLNRHHWREGLFDSFRSALFIKCCMALEQAATKHLMGLEDHELADYLPCEGARIHLCGIDREPETEMLLYSFYSKPYGAYGDWHVQQCRFPEMEIDVDAEFFPSPLKAVPDSAYQMPNYFVHHPFENSGAFWSGEKGKGPGLTRYESRLSSTSGGAGKHGSSIGENIGLFGEHTKVII